MSVSQTSDEPLLAGGNINIDTIKSKTKLSLRRTKGKTKHGTHVPLKERINQFT